MQKTLKEVRESKGVKKGAVARAMGVVYPTYQRYEETNRMPSDAFAKACDFLGVSRDDIFLEINLANETERTMNESYIGIELGGWNIPEAITVEAEPVEARDFSDFEL